VRLILESCLYILRLGIPWRDLPRERFGPWQTVYHRFRQWARLGVWQKVLQRLARGARGTLRMVDATFCKVHQFANIKADRRPGEAVGKSKGGWNTKINVLVDCRGRALRLVLTAGNRHDLQAVDQLTGGLRGVVLVADRGYDCDQLRACLGSQRVRPCIPPRKKRKHPASYHRGWYRKRHKVENFFGWIKKFGRIDRRYDKSAASFSAFVHFAAVLHWLTVG